MRMGDLLETENSLILREYSADFDEKNPAEITVYLSITPEIHYSIQITFKQYPEKPQLIIPQTLSDELGDPQKFLTSFQNWNNKNPPHIVEIIREFEQVLQRVIYPNDEMEAVMNEFNSHMSGPYKLHVLLYSYKMKTYEYEINHKKPNSPSIIFSPDLQKFLQVNEIHSLKQWPRASLVDICREISQKIDHRSRIIDELKQLDQSKFYQKIIKKWDAKGLIFEVRVEIETGEYCVLEFTLPEEFPMAPPDIELRTTHPEENRQQLSELLLAQYNQWQPATTLIEILDNIKSFLQRKSKNICQICYQYHCPKCHKPIKQTKIQGISGELDCNQRCRSCNANFHKCCWIDQIKYTRKCPTCLSQQTLFF